jgi:hypothetical protein
MRHGGLIKFRIFMQEPFHQRLVASAAYKEAVYHSRGILYHSRGTLYHSGGIV